MIWPPVAKNPLQAHNCYISWATKAIYFIQILIAIEKYYIQYQLIFWQISQPMQCAFPSTTVFFTLNHMQMSSPEWMQNEFQETRSSTDTTGCLEIQFTDLFFFLFKMWVRWCVCLKDLHSRGLRILPGRWPSWLKVLYFLSTKRSKVDKIVSTRQYVRRIL
jgi:hypothetical protein